MVVRFITRRFIGEYDPNLEKVYTYSTVIDNEVILFEILDAAGHINVWTKKKTNKHIILFLDGGYCAAYLKMEIRKSNNLLLFVFIGKRESESGGEYPMGRCVHSHVLGDGQMQLWRM